MEFIQAKHFTARPYRKIDGIVIHTMEAPEKGSTAESVAKYFQKGERKASAHYCIDNDSVVQCVKDKDIAYHAPGVNHNFLGFEHAGYARQTKEEWADKFSSDMLVQSALLAAEKCKRYDLPVVWLSIDDLKAGKRGLTSHDNVSKAFKKSTHYDPGVNFPVEFYLELVRFFMNPFVPPQEAPQVPPFSDIKEGEFMQYRSYFINVRLDANGNGYNDGPELVGQVVGEPRYNGSFYDGNDSTLYDVPNFSRESYISDGKLRIEVVGAKPHTVASFEVVEIY